MARVYDESPQSTFFMLGIIHRDARNDTVIEEWIKGLKPAVVTLELSSYGLVFRQEKGREYHRRIDDICRVLRSEGCPCPPDDLSYFYSYVNVPREFEIASAYCRENKAHLYLVDVGLFSYAKLRKIDELICEENIRKSLLEDKKGQGAAEKVLAGLFFGSGVTAFQYTNEMAFRDRFMCGRIGTLMKHSSGERLLHITGWQHLKDPLGIYSRLGPVKIYPYD